MPTLPHTRCHAPQRQLGGLEPQEHDFNTISRFSPGLESPHVGQPAQRARRLKRVMISILTRMD